MKQTNFDIPEEKLKKILEFTEEIFEVDINDVMKKNRKRKVALARHCLSYALYYYYSLTFMSLGRLLNRDHSSIINSVKVVDSRMSYQNEDKEMIEDYINNIKEFLNHEEDKDQIIKSLKIRLSYYKNKCEKLQRQYYEEDKDQIIKTLKIRLSYYKNKCEKLQRQLNECN
jgi:hypothetical protein